MRRKPATCTTTFLLARLLGTLVDFFLPLVTDTKTEHVALVDTAMSVSRTLAKELKLDLMVDRTGNSNRSSK